MPGTLAQQSERVGGPAVRFGAWGEVVEECLLRESGPHPLGPVCPELPHPRPVVLSWAGVASDCAAWASRALKASA